jgi:anthranilate/para-aminobenzoate synthase component II
MKVLLIDNYDSFTYNLVHYLEKLGAVVVVYRNDAKELNSLDFDAFDGVVLSPGPGLPEEGVLLKGVTEFQVGLYHSWAAEREKLAGWKLAAVALEEGAPMVIESKSDKAYGVQFHPESVLTPQGLRMITNWLALIH